MTGRRKRFTPKSRRSVGATAAVGIVLDPEIRRAAAQAVPPVTRLAFAVGKRMARQEARRLTPSKSRRRRILASVAGGGTLLAVAVLITADASRRRKLEPPAAH